jgi:hypothetical protein
MKKFIVFLVLIAIFPTVKSSIYDPNPYRKIAVSYIIAGMAMTPVFDHFWFNSQRNEDGMYFSTSFDPRMVCVEQSLDYRLKLSGLYYRFSPSILYERFEKMHYEGYSLGLDYLVFNKKLSLLAGIEVTKLTDAYYKQKEKINKLPLSYGINTEIRLLTKTRFSFSYVSNVKSRPELNYNKRILYSGYLQVNIRLTK